VRDNVKERENDGERESVGESLKEWKCEKGRRARE